MENIPVKLASAPIPEFNYFVDNQVLTAGQLNTLVEYFDRQNRLTRARLIGSGIVCGLDLSFRQGALTLGKGLALTTDGDLLVWPEDRILSRARAFSDVRAKYAWHSGITDGNPADIPLLEVLTDDADQEGDPFPLSALNDLSQMVVVMYLESYLRPPEDCTDTDCDNLGPKQINRLRVLMLREGDVAAIMPNKGQRASFFPDPVVRRVRMGGSVVTGDDNLGRRVEEAVDGSLPGIRTALEISAFQYAPVVGMTSGFGADWTNLLNTGIGRVRNIQNGVQYAYNALKDVADALAELKETVADLDAACLLPAVRFPKHVVVSEVSAAMNGAEPAFRQYFIESPQLNRGDRTAERIRSILRRIDLMLRGFRVPDNRGGVKITPSRFGGYLRDRAIPFYFATGSANPLEREWNYDKTRRQAHRHIKSYSANSYSNEPDVITPLQFTHDDCQFYRIEGILGREKDGVLTELTKLRNDHNLPFRVEAIQIEDDTRRFTLPPRIRLPWWETVWSLHRENIFDHLQLAKDYAVKLNDAGTDSSVPADSEVRGRVNSAKSKAVDMRSKVEDTAKATYVSARTMAGNYTAFKQNYADAIKMSYDVNADIHQLAQTPTESPLHQVAVFNKGLQLERLVDILGKKTDLVKRQYIFDHFQNQHPGMEPLCGVPAGGTFIVVHQNDRVVADFALPYAVEFDLDPEVDVDPPAVTVRPPISLIDPNKFKWLDKFHYFKDPGFDRAINLRLDAVLPPLKSDLADFKRQIDYKVNSTDIFVKDWLPSLGRSGLATNPGTGGGAIFDGGNRITDPGLRDRYERMNELVYVTNYLERTGASAGEIAKVRQELDQSVVSIHSYTQENEGRILTTDVQYTANAIGSALAGSSQETKTQLQNTQALTATATQINTVVVNNAIFNAIRVRP